MKLFEESSVRFCPTAIWRSLGLGVVLAATVSLSSGRAQDAGTDFRPVRVLGPQPVIQDIPIKSVREMDSVLAPSELVLGVTIGDQSRAYPINMLTGPSREILNDSLGGQAIAATW